MCTRRKWATWHAASPSIPQSWPLTWLSCARTAKAARAGFLFGDIAQQVISLGTTPVLMVRPSKERQVIGAAGDFRTILVPINGDPGHEKGLPMATEIARAFHCRLHLLMVVPELRDLTGSKAAASLILPGATRLNLEMESDGARTYLDQRAAELNRERDPGRLRDLSRRSGPRHHCLSPSSLGGSGGHGDPWSSRGRRVLGRKCGRACCGSHSSAGDVGPLGQKRGAGWLGSKTVSAHGQSASLRGRMLGDGE